MSYIDCFLAPVPSANRSEYELLAKISAQVVKEHGALRVVECWLDDAGPDASTYHGETARGEPGEYGSFIAAAGAKHGETVVMSWIEWPDKASRDAGMEKVTSDPRMQFEGKAPAFDGSRLIAAGFLPMLDEARGA
ncbi:DUF1428 domain-containing protein [Ramlibacter tataouinensis]|uniref:RNA signal recognition particle 4.5S RNA n=1 Tax=Ramlibacter tataouinensis (strain ATCC BAA-407 / DSM 14655 / LMG 21543 / TTB310) TaxID=365046 RepID=F5XY16_RAMTT|nr:DUF1428 domain-containing protein [Ramlibacter tataouinensis]AEG94341.1 conserved hypothetical protein [Ramlibacter tataouinensis TTB310]